MSIWKVTVVYNLGNTPFDKNLRTEAVGIRAQTGLLAIKAGKKMVEDFEVREAAARRAMGADAAKAKVNHHRSHAELIYRLD